MLKSLVQSLTMEHYRGHKLGVMLFQVKVHKS